MAGLLTPLFGCASVSRAEKLLSEFGSIAALSAAPVQSLERAFGHNQDFASMFAVSRGIIEAGMRERAHRTPVDTADPAFLNYLLLRLSALHDERMLAIYLDRDHRFLAEHSFESASADCIVIRPRSLFRPAMALDCGAMVLAHNHPSGAATPSALDISATKKIARHGALLEIELVDHLIVGRTEVISMRRAGML